MIVATIKKTLIANKLHTQQCEMEVWENEWNLIGSCQLYLFTPRIRFITEYDVILVISFDYSKGFSNTLDV